MKRDTLSLIVLGALLVGLLVWQKGGIALPPWVPTTTAKVTAATYFYNEDTTGGIPSPVAKALSQLNEQGIDATTFEVETTNSAGKTPKQYAVSLPAALKAGIPCLVVMAGDKVVKIVPSPTTEASVTEAAK